ncbi:MAG: hypothetical protein Q4G42_00990 [Neisseria sp.]|nr:hypothetical protein [Neisseria sp.]
MQAFRAEFHTSRRVRIALAVLHGASLYGVWRYFSGSYALGMAAVLLGSLLYTQYLYSRAYRLRIGRLDVLPDGSALLYFGDSDYPVAARPLSGSLISPYALLIVWRLEDDARTVRQAIFPSMTAAQAYRRLCVWLRYGRHDEAA